MTFKDVLQNILMIAAIVYLGLLFVEYAIVRIGDVPVPQVHENYYVVTVPIAATCEGQAI